MIVPSSRLLFWSAWVILPFTLLGTFVPAAFLPAMILILALVLAAVIDAMISQKSLAGISVELPPVMRMSKDREGKMEMRIRNAGQARKNLRVALAWPAKVIPEAEEQTIVLPAGSEWSRVTWTCKPLERGNFKLNAAYLETPSPMGFWAVRTKQPVALEFRVYPSLMTERKNLAALFLNRGAFGLHAHRQVGKGRSFEKLREYVPGDGYDEIHWKATARRGKPVTKVFQIEKTQEVYVIVDASRLSARPVKMKGGTVTGLERFITSALVFGLAAEKQGDLFGLLTYTNRIEKFVRAKNGRAHYSACRDALYTLEPKIVTPDFDELCAFIRTRLRRRSLLIFLTALDDPAIAESFLTNINLISRQHLIMVNMLQPPGMGPLFADDAVQNIDEIYEKLGDHLRWQKLRGLQKALKRQGVQFSMLENEQLSAQMVSQYLNVKQRQLL